MVARVAERARRAGLAALLLVLGAAPGAADSLDHQAAPALPIRVLLAREPGPVQLHHASGESVEVRAGRHGLLANGRPAGQQVRVEGPRPVGFAGRRYRGRLIAERDEDGLRVVNEVPLEAYLAGTLMREVYPGWEGEMLRAQAVVARTYALHERQRRLGRAWHVRAGTRSQVYEGVEAETPAAWKAVRDTRGEFLSFDGEPILAVYHSASGGRTASAEEVWGRPLPYLVSVEVDGEEQSPDTYWRAQVSRGALEQALETLGRSVGRVQRIEVSQRTASGRVSRVRLNGSRGVAEVSARRLRRTLGNGRLRSTFFEVRPADGGFAFVGSGYGHGVGMSQWGGQAMARRGADYHEILEKFYPGAELEGGRSFLFGVPAALGLE